MSAEAANSSSHLAVPGAADKKKGVLGRLGHGLKNSPKMVRKAMGSVKKRIAVGKSKDNSSLKDCQENGWLYKDDQIKKGINYRVKYLGSVEVEYDPASTENNQNNAQKAMRALYGHAKVTKQTKSLNSMALSVSVDRITLLTIEGAKTVMRHSTTRIAYSTVDTEKPKIFAYVAVVKNTDLALCHVFRCKNAKQGYEMTFVCAQAFDTNFRRWREDKQKAAKQAIAAEADDIEATQAWQKKKTPEEQAKAKADGNSGGDEATKAKAPAPTAASPLSPNREQKIFLAIQEGQDPADLAAQYFDSIGISMIEDDDDDVLEDPLHTGGMMQLGVDTDAYNQASDNSAGGYMTVGDSLNFNDEESEDDEEL